MPEKNEQIISLAEDIVKNIELSELPITNVILKCLRLARLTENKQATQLFQYELSGYPHDDSGFVLQHAFELSRLLNRTFKEKNKDGVMTEFMFSETVAELEGLLESDKRLLEVSSVPMERTYLPQKISKLSDRLNKVKGGCYRYAVNVLLKYKFAVILEDIFARTRARVDEELQLICPEGFKKFVVAYDNLKAKEEENWALAVHSCRRILLDVADSLFPPSDLEVETKSGKTKLDSDHYILRLKEYVKSKSSSESLIISIGSELEGLSNRIDSIYKCTTKGSHDKVSKEEAERDVIYTYLLIGDILSLS